MKKQFTIEGWFEIKEGDKVVRVAKNDWLNSGLRWILSLPFADMTDYGGGVGAGGAIAAIYPQEIHWGSGTLPLDPTLWHLQYWTGTLTITNFVRVAANHIRLESAFANPATYVSEVAVALTNIDPTSETNYANAIIDRALIIPAYNKDVGLFPTISYNMKIEVT